MNIQFVENPDRLARIKVLGIGGAGGNAVNRMIEAGLVGVEFHAINTDAQALKQSRAHQVLAIGAERTRGLGAGGNPAVGREAALEDHELIARLVDGADMVFVTAGMGGGTGTGAAPVAAAAARAAGALTVAIVTKPFQFEGDVRRRQAEAGIAALRDEVDTLIVIPNQRLLEVVAPTATMQEAFRTADEVLYQATRGIYEIISRPAVVNLDFADVRTVMEGMGVALVGTGHAAGADRALVAARAAVASPLLEDVQIRGAQAVLVNLVGAQVTLQDTSQAMQYVQEAAGQQAHIIFGYGTDDALGEELQVTVIATGFPAQADQAADASATATSFTWPRPLAPVAFAETAGGQTVEAPQPPVEIAAAPQPDPVVEAATVAPPLPPEPAPAVEPEREPEVVLACERDVVQEPGSALEREPEPEPASEPALEPELELEPEPPYLRRDDPPATVYTTAAPFVAPPAPVEPVRIERAPIEPVRLEPAPAERLAEEMPVAAARETFAPAAPAPAESLPWAMAAAAGETESRWRPQQASPAAARVEPAAAAPTAAPPTQSSVETAQRFLRPAGSQDLRPGPRQTVRGDALVDDLNVPAYTRKYMD